MAWSATQVLAAPSSTAAPAECFPSGTKTLALTDQARIYTRKNGARYSCFFKTGKRSLLATPAKPLRSLRAAGPFAAFSQAAYHDGAIDDDVPWQVISVGLCRDAHDYRARKYVVATTRVTDLVVSRYGDIAWIARGAGGYVVYKMDAGTADPHQPTVVAEDVDAKSLTIEGARIRWTANGQAAANRLEPRVAVCRP